jgi:hypothetical protein
LSWDLYPVRDAQFNAAREGSFAAFPYLECANLNGANLTNLPLALLLREVDGRRTNLATATGDIISTPRMKLTTFDKGTRVDALGVLLQFHVWNHNYVGLSADRRKIFDKGFWIDNASWPVGFGDFNVSNISQSEVVGSGRTAGDSEETAFVKTRVFNISDPTGIDQWAKPLFKAALDQTIWKSLPVVSRIIANSQVSSDSVSELYIGGGHPPDSCSQTSVPSPPDLTIVFIPTTAKE